MKAKIKASEKETLVRHGYPEIVDDMGLANTDPGLLDFVLEGSLAILDFFARKAVTVHIDRESRSVKLSEKQKFRKPKQHSFNSGMLSEIIMFTFSKKKVSASRQENCNTGNSHQYQKSSPHSPDKNRTPWRGVQTGDSGFRTVQPAVD